MFNSNYGSEYFLYYDPKLGSKISKKSECNSILSIKILPQIRMILFEIKIFFITLCRLEFYGNFYRYLAYI